MALAGFRLRRLLKASLAGLLATGMGALAPASWPEVLDDRGVLRPEANGDGLGWIGGKAEKALEVFMGGFFWALLDEVEAGADQSMPAKSSMVFILSLGEKTVLGDLVYSKTTKHVIRIEEEVVLRTSRGTRIEKKAGMGCRAVWNLQGA